jgi:competence protein ComEA
MESTSSNERLRWLLTLLIIALTVFAVWMWWRASSIPNPAPPLPARMEQQPDVTVAPSAAPARIGVDIVGAVQQPGLYYLPPEARVDDAVKAAGGFAPDANRDGVNLAARLKDEQQLRIPHVEEPAPQAARAEAVPAADVTEAPGARRVDLNTADAQALEALPGVGPATARQIVDYRSAHGPYRSVEQLDDVPGIGPGTINALRDLVTIGN